MEPNFQEIFQQLTIDETNSTRFLLKMESFGGLALELSISGINQSLLVLKSC